MVKENDDVIMGTPYYHIWVDGKKACGQKNGSWPQKYMTDAMAMKVKACPDCSEIGEVRVPTLVKRVPKVKEQDAPPTIQKRGLYLRQFVK